jgi:primase-polymerase (primpol)-like protein
MAELSALKCQNCKAEIAQATAASTGGSCLPCFRKMPHSTQHASVRADQEAWSEESKRSRSYSPGAEVHYYDEYYWCSKCAVACVFSAEQQRIEFEVKKRYIHATRQYCDLCHAAAKRNGEVAP